MYPNNPATGAIAPLPYLETVVRRCRELNILLVYDNPYSEMTFDGYVAPSIFDVKGARDIALEFHSMSKTFNMTGWRCGWACGEAGIRERAGEDQDVRGHGPVSGRAIRCRGGARRGEGVGAGKHRGVQGAAGRHGARLSRKRGFYLRFTKGNDVFAGFPLPKGITSNEFSERLLDSGVIVLPGSGLGAGGGRGSSAFHLLRRRSWIAPSRGARGKRCFARSCKLSGSRCKLRVSSALPVPRLPASPRFRPACLRVPRQTSEHFTKISGSLPRHMAGEYGDDLFVRADDRSCRPQLPGPRHAGRAGRLASHARSVDHRFRIEDFVIGHRCDDAHSFLWIACTARYPAGRIANANRRGQRFSA